MALNCPTIGSALTPTNDVELVDLSTTDYAPSSGFAKGFIICGSTGAVKIDALTNTAIVIPSGLTAGVIHWIAFKKIYKTGTTATNIVAVG